MFINSTVFLETLGRDDVFPGGIIVPQIFGNQVYPEAPGAVGRIQASAQTSGICREPDADYVFRIIRGCLVSTSPPIINP